MSIESNKLVNLADAQVLYNDLRDRESDLKSALVFQTSKSIDVEQGYWAIATGLPTESNTWCRIVTYINRNLVIASSTMKMFLLAYALDGTYVGTWNGTTFSTTYSADKYLKKIIVNEWLDSYPSYRFRIDFTSSGNITPANVLSDITIKDYTYNRIDDLKGDLITAEAIANNGEYTLHPTIVNGYTINQSTGALVSQSGSTQYVVTDFIEVIPGTTISVEGQNVATWSSDAWVSYQADKTTIVSHGAAPLNVTGAKYFRLSNYRSNSDHSALVVKYKTELKKTGRCNGKPCRFHSERIKQCC